MRSESDYKIQNRPAVFFLTLILVSALSSCGYRVIGSRPLPFDSITIKQVRNNTYEPGLEERLHIALAAEFINQGIEIRSEGGDVELEATVTHFALGAIAAIDEIVKEQDITMNVSIRMVESEKIISFASMSSPIKITFQSTGEVSDSVAQKEVATNKASREIAKEIVSQIIVRYAK